MRKIFSRGAWSMKLSPRLGDMHERFCSGLTHRYFIRAHMTVMLSMVLLSGLVASRALLRAGVTNMGLRYPISVFFSYVVFLGLIRLWLAYMCRVAQAARLAAADSTRSSGGGFLDDSSGWSGSAGSGGSGEFAGGGGGSGGGGSSGDFGRSGGSDSGSGGGKGSSSSSSSSSGGGGDGDGLLLLLLFVLLVAAVFGAGAYLVFQAPAILSEAAFHAVLAAGLIKSARDVHEPSWMGGVLKATAIPFAIVLILSGVFGYQAHKRCPGSFDVRQVFRNCILG
jgi:hypothetical protein